VCLAKACMLCARARVGTRACACRRLPEDALPRILASWSTRIQLKCVLLPECVVLYSRLARVLPRILASLSIRAKSAATSKIGEHFSKVLHSVALHRNYTMAMTFKNLCQGLVGAE
jgi:hypothetical protein